MKIENLTEDQAKKILSELVEKLDDLDQHDYFGTEGWRTFLNLESTFSINI